MKFNSLSVWLFRRSLLGGRADDRFGLGQAGDSCRVRLVEGGGKTGNRGIIELVPRPVGPEAHEVSLKPGSVQVVPSELLVGA